MLYTPPINDPALECAASDSHFIVVCRGLYFCIIAAHRSTSQSLCCNARSPSLRLSSYLHNLRAGLPFFGRLAAFFGITVTLWQVDPSQQLSVDIAIPTTQTNLSDVSSSEAPPLARHLISGGHVLRLLWS